MSLVEKSQGLTDVSGSRITETIFSAPPDEKDLLNVTIASATQELAVGQFITMASTTSASQEWGKLANKAAVQAETKPIAILTKAISQTHNEGVTTAIVKGRFKQASLTPNDVPKGVYANGNIIID